LKASFSPPPFFPPTFSGRGSAAFPYSNEDSPPPPPFPSLTYCCYTIGEDESLFFSILPGRPARNCRRLPFYPPPPPPPIAAALHQGRSSLLSLFLLFFSYLSWTRKINEIDRESCPPPSPSLSFSFFLFLGGAKEKKE